MKVPRRDAWRFIKVPCKSCQKLFTRHARNQVLCSSKCYRRNNRPTNESISACRRIVDACNRSQA